MSPAKPPSPPYQIAQKWLSLGLSGVIPTQGYIQTWQDRIIAHDLSAVVQAEYLACIGCRRSSLLGCLRKCSTYKDKVSQLGLKLLSSLLIAGDPFSVAQN